MATMKTLPIAFQPPRRRLCFSLPFVTPARIAKKTAIAG
jgi:hypothetical protein